VSQKQSGLWKFCAGSKLLNPLLITKLYACLWS